MRTILMVPTYNEAENIGQLIEAIFAQDASLEVVVVDDASPDGTGTLVESLAEQDSRVHIIHRSGPRGYAAASREGLRWCLDRGYDVLGTIDADLSQDPCVLPQMRGRISAGDSLVIGSRYVEGGSLEVDWGPVRRAVSVSGSAYARFMVGTTVRDCTSGYRLYRASALESVPFEAITADGYSFLIELLALFVGRGELISEVPIRYVDRQRGASKISKTIIFEALIRTTVLGGRRVSKLSSNGARP